MKLRAPTAAPAPRIAPPSLPMGRDHERVLELLARHAKNAGVSMPEAMRQILEAFTQDPEAASAEAPSIAGPWDKPMEGRWARIECPQHPELPERVRAQAQAAGITAPELIRRAVRRFLREQGHTV